MLDRLARVVQVVALLPAAARQRRLVGTDQILDVVERGELVLELCGQLAELRTGVARIRGLLLGVRGAVRAVTRVPEVLQLERVVRPGLVGESHVGGPEVRGPARQHLAGYVGERGRVVADVDRGRRVGGITRGARVWPRLGDRRREDDVVERAAGPGVRRTKKNDPALVCRRLPARIAVTVTMLRPRRSPTRGASLPINLPPLARKRRVTSRRPSCTVSFAPAGRRTTTRTGDPVTVASALGDSTAGDCGLALAAPAATSIASKQMNPNAAGRAALMPPIIPDPYAVDVAPRARPPSPIPRRTFGLNHLVPVDDAAKRRALRHTPPVLDVELFTDPACPFAFSAEPVRRRLRWHYGDQLALDHANDRPDPRAGRGRASSPKARPGCSGATACRSTRAVCRGPRPPSRRAARSSRRACTLPSTQERAAAAPARSRSCSAGCSTTPS